MFKKVFLNYDLSRIKNANHRVNSNSAISTKIFKKDSKFPNSYCEENTRIHQLWWESKDFNLEKINEQLKFEVKTISSIVVPPGSIIPEHKDTFFKLKQEFPNEDGKMVRAVIYATPFYMGQITQYMMIDNTIFNSDNWTVGEGLLWDDQVLHVTVNGSLHDLCIVNFSGFMSTAQYQLI